MIYQLVLQFRGNSLEDYDALIALEEELIETLHDSAEIDGHDVGVGEANIFILTTDPLGTFEQTKAVLKNRLNAVKAGYRPVNGEEYILLWPEGLEEELTVS